MCFKNITYSARLLAAKLIQVRGFSLAVLVLCCDGIKNHHDVTPAEPLNEENQESLLWFYSKAESFSQTDLPWTTWF